MAEQDNNQQQASQGGQEAILTRIAEILARQEVLLQQIIDALREMNAVGGGMA